MCIYICIEYFLSNYISIGAVDLNTFLDVGNNPSNPYIQRKQNKEGEKVLNT